MNSSLICDQAVARTGLGRRDPAGRNTDKFQATGLTRIPAVVVKPPRVAERPTHVECRIVDRVDTGDHPIFVGEVVVKSGDADAMKDEARNERMEPLFHLGGKNSYAVVSELTSTGSVESKTPLKIREIQFAQRNLALVVGAVRWAYRVYGGDARSQRLPNQKTVISSSKSEKGFKIAVKVLYTLSSSIMEFKAHRSPYLELSLITCGGPHSI